MQGSTRIGWHFARPELAAHHLRAFDLGLISATALHARRRMGKTEFLTRDLTPAAQQKGYSVGYCNLWQEDRDPVVAIAEAITQCSLPRRAMAKMRAKLGAGLSTIKLSGKLTVLEGSAEVGFKKDEKAAGAMLRSAFKAFDKSKNVGLLLIDEAQLLADKRHASLEMALRALLDTRKDRLKVIFTGSSEDRLRTMFGAENKAFYNWARVEPLPLLGEEFVRELTKRANALTTVRLKLADTLKAFDSLMKVPELFRRFLSQYLGNPLEGVAQAVYLSKQSIYTEAGLAKRWGQLQSADKVVLQWVAQGTSDLHSLRSLAKLGKALKLGRSADRSVPQNALRRLRDRQILIQSETGVYRFEDEAFQEWIQSETATTLGAGITPS
jgi:hypothetical protein